MEENDFKSQQQQSHAPPGFMQDTPPRADVDEILRRKRKAREYKVSLRAVGTVGEEEMGRWMVHLFGGGGRGGVCKRR